MYHVAFMLFSVQIVQIMMNMFHPSRKLRSSQSVQKEAVAYVKSDLTVFKKCYMINNVL